VKLNAGFLKSRPVAAALSTVVAAGLFAASALAHHSTAMFEWGKEKQLEGTVDKFEWTQPHAFLWVKVPGKDGKEQEWGLEGMSPSWLGRNKWNRNSVKAGEKVKIGYYPLRDGRNGGFFVRVTLPDGTELQGLPGRPRP
jgi:hypothetical protein